MCLDTVRVEHFMQFKIVSYLENFAGSNSRFHMGYNFRVISHPRKNGEQRMMKTVDFHPLAKRSSVSVTVGLLIHNSVTRTVLVL